MFVLLVVSYFVAACCMAFLVLFPSGRAALARALANGSTLVGKRKATWHAQATKAATGIGATMEAAAGAATMRLRTHSLVLCTTAAVLVMPTLAALFFSDRFAFHGFDDSRHPINSHVAELLEGEHLAPPQPLPPDLFTTQEVTQVRPLLGSASRNWQQLDADFSRRLLTVFKIMREKHGYELTIIEGYRSPERQNMLARLGTGVTNAAAFQSYHQFGLASDCAFIRDGKLVISEKDPWAMEGYQLFGMVAESVGLTWGGRWKMMDLGHVELRVPGTLKR